MDFFEHQEQARRKTGLLIFYFILALLGIIGATYTLVIGILIFTGENEGGNFIRPGVLAATAGVTCLVVFLASTFKSLQLSGGGGVSRKTIAQRD